MKKRIISLLIAVVVLLGMMPFAAFAAEDTRTVISVVTGTSNMGAPEYGDVVQTAFDFTFTEGTQCSVPGSMGYWEKKNGEDWERYDSSTFSEGTYRYSNQLRINSPLGEQYKFDETVEITIDGKQWTHDTFYDYNTYLYGYMTSPEFTVEWKKIPLVFNDSYSFDIKKVYTNTAIAGFSVAESVVGGVAPYTFSKTSGPAWINVAADGTISGTPTEVEENDDLVIRVTDSEGEFQEITVWVTDTLMDPALRTKIDTVVGTSNIGTPAYGDAVKTAFDFTFTEGVGCNVPGSMGYWEKKNGEEWVGYNGVTFVEGTYRYSNQLRIDGANGAVYQFADEVNITIDGQIWTNDGFDNYDSYCYGYMTSPEFTVELPPVPELLFIDSNEYDIPQGYADRAIVSFSVADAVSGGVAPYTFSKEFGPAWLNVAADGTVSGTPTASVYTQSATLRVTDAEGTYKEIIISIAVIYINPANREELHTVVASSNMAAPSYGEEVKDVTFSITEGGEARFGGGSLQGWYIKEEGDWVAYDGDTFEAGTYRYQNPIYVDGSVGHTHRLSAPLSVTVDGTAWEVGEITVEDDRSYVVVASPEVEVHKCTVVPGQKANCTTDGWKDYYDCVCGKHFEDTAATTEITDLDAWKIGAGKIAAGHTYGTLIEAKPEVHTQSKLEASVAAHYFCDVCDTYFTEGKVATTLQALTGAVPSHKYTNACDKDCNDCGKTRTPAAHKGGTATCKEKAKCAVCGVSYGALAGHKFGDYVYNGDATATKDGTKTRTCSVCKKTETITAAGTKRTNPFKDVKLADYFCEPVLWAVEKEITNGMDATHFAPANGCTRGQVVTFLWRAAGKPKASGSNPFKDVKKADYFYDAVLWAVENGITNGMDATHFAPDSTCTRGQIVTFLYRAAGKPKVSGSNPFKDVKKTDYFYDAVLWAVKNEITNGMDATHFGPDSTCTRGQVVTFLYRKENNK